MAFSFIVLGGFGLFVGGQLLVQGAVASAKTLRIPQIFIGLVLVGLCASTPKLATSLQAAIWGLPCIAIGNAVGNNIVNVLLILGLASVLVPITVNARAILRDGAAMVLATGLGLAVVRAGEINRLAGALLVTALVLYFSLTLIGEKRLDQSPESAVYEAKAAIVPEHSHPLLLSLLIAILGLAITIFSARFLVSGAVLLAQIAGVSKAVVGLTVVAITTSMPVMMAAVWAAYKGKGDVAVGIVLGANIFNVLGILGIVGIVRPLIVPPEIIRFDILAMAASTMFLLYFVMTDKCIGRREGVVMLACYASYLGWQLHTPPIPGL